MTLRLKYNYMWCLVIDQYGFFKPQHLEERADLHEASRHNEPFLQNLTPVHPLGSSSDRQWFTMADTYHFPRTYPQLLFPPFSVYIYFPATASTLHTAVFFTKP